MSEFSEHGFLGTNQLGANEQMHRLYNAYISIGKRLNTQAQAIQYRLNIHNEYIPEIVSSILYSRVLSTYQGAFIISFNAMKPLTEILVRCCMEPLFPLVAISRDVAFAEKYVLAEEHQRLKSLRGFADYKKRNKQANAKIDNKIIKQIELNIKNQNIEELSIRQCAKRANLIDYYDTVYAFTSATLHASPRSLETALEMNSERTKITAIKNEPEFTGYDILYPTLIEILGKAMVAISEIFKLEYPKIVDECHQELTTLIKPQ